MNYSFDLETRIDALLEKRGISGHTAAERFVADFKAYMCYFAHKFDASAEATIALLEDDSKLVNSEILNKNFRATFADLIPDALMQDPIFPTLFKQLLDNNGKGIGIGELVLPLILTDYSFSTVSDGEMANGAKVEIKKNGASLKPVATGLTDKGLVDKLNKKYFNGTAPGKVQKKQFEQHLAEVKDPTTYADYFRELYVGCDTTELAEEVQKVYTDAQAFNKAVGKFALKNYQRVDGWNNILYIDDKKMTVVNIADITDIDSLGVKFSPKLLRGGDTQAIADGYVNVKI